MSLVERVKTRALRTALRGLFAWERLTRGAVYDPIGRRNLDDPYPMYRRLRERDPIHPSRLVEGFVVSRYHDVIGVVRDARFSADERNAAGFERERRRRIAAGLQREQDPYNPSMLRLDPPDHTRIRSLVSRAFTPRAVQRLRPRIETIVKELLDDVHGAGELDLIEDLGYPLPVTVIAEMLGIPTEDRAQFKYWSDEIARGLGFGPLEDERRSQVASRQLESYLGEVVEKRRVEPRDDLISGMVQAEEAEDKLSTQEIYSTCLLLLVAGNETTTNLIGNGMLALLRNPDQLARLREDRSPRSCSATTARCRRPSDSRSRTSSSRTARSCAKGSRSSCCSAPPTATRKSSTSPSAWTWGAARTVTSPSAWAYTIAWARSSRASRRRSRSARWSSASITSSLPLPASSGATTRSCAA
jgi:cytochrome P450